MRSGENYGQDGNVYAVDPDEDHRRMQRLPENIRQHLLYEAIGPYLTEQIEALVEQHGAEKALHIIRISERVETTKAYGEKHPNAIKIVQRPLRA